MRAWPLISPRPTDLHPQAGKHLHPPPQSLYCISRNGVTVIRRRQMERHGLMPGAPHLAMRPEPERRLYEPDYESDTGSSSSGRSSSPSDYAPQRTRRNRDTSLFIDATIAQDDTGPDTTAEGLQLLADMGPGMATRGTDTLRN